MAVSAQQVKDLRDQTGAGMMDCKRALEEAGGDLEKARMVLRERGLAKAVAKGSREATEGAVVSYVHHDGRVGVLVELACETDFVARNAEFLDLARGIAMHVAFANPRVASPEQLPPEVVETERQLYGQQAADKPEKVRDRMVEGKLEKFYEQVCLLRQPYVRDDSRSVSDVVKDAIAKLGENIEVRRFVRIELGQVS